MPDAAAEPAPAPAGPTLGELVAGSRDDSGDRRSQLGALTRAARRAARGAGTGARGARPAARRRARGRRAPDTGPGRRRRCASHHPGRSDDEIADALVRNAGRTTGTFGAAVGALAAVEFAAPPSYLVAPVQLAAETLAVAAVEVKLIAELHELYGEAGRRHRHPARLRVPDELGAPARPRPQGRRRRADRVLGVRGQARAAHVLVRRMGRSMSKLAPFLAGAVAGAAVNRRVTRTLGDKADRRAAGPPPHRAARVAG